MYCEFELLKYRYSSPSIIQIKIRDDNDTLMLIVNASYHHKAYRFDYSSIAYGHKECIEFLTSNNLAIIYRTTKEPDIGNYKFPTIYKLKLTPKALMYAL